MLISFVYGIIPILILVSIAKIGQIIKQSRNS